MDVSGSIVSKSNLMKLLEDSIEGRSEKGLETKRERKDK